MSILGKEREKMDRQIVLDGRVLVGKLSFKFDSLVRRKFKEANMTLDERLNLPARKKI